MPAETATQQRSHNQINETPKKNAWHTPDVVELDMHQTQSGGTYIFSENSTCSS